MYPCFIAVIKHGYMFYFLILHCLMWCTVKMVQRKFNVLFYSDEVDDNYWR